MIEVEGPDGTIAEFPDGTSHDVIKSAMQKRFGPPKAVEAPPGYGGASVDTSDPRPRWDIFGDVGRAYDESKAALKQHVAEAYADGPKPSEDPIGAVKAMASRDLARLRLPLDAIATLTAPLTGGARASIGSLMSYLPTGYDPETGIKTLGKTKGDEAADLGMMGLSPRGVGPKGVIAKPASAPAPTVEALKNATDAAYARARGSNLEIQPSSTENLANDIKTDLLKRGFRDINEPKTFAAVDELKNPPGATVQVADVEQPRRVLNNIGPETSDGKAAGIARKAIDTYLENVPPQDVVSGNPAGVASNLREARGNYSAAKRAELIDEAVHKAELNASSAGSGANLDNAIRQQLKIIAKNPDALRGFSDEEIRQLERAVKGTWTGNTLRFIGNLLGGGGGIGTFLTAGRGGAALGPGGVALPAVGMAAKRMGAASTSRQVDLLHEMLRARSPLGQAQANGPVGPQPLPQRNPLIDALVIGHDGATLNRNDPLASWLPR